MEPFAKGRAVRWLSPTAGAVAWSLPPGGLCPGLQPGSPGGRGSDLHGHSVQHLKCPVSAKIVRRAKGQGYVNHTEEKQQTQALPVVGAADEASKQPLCLRG